MFAFHRYYRTRDINNAAHWFTVMSCVSFFNIWLSYSLQEFVTEYGSRKSISMSQRNEYHQNAYKSYVERVQNETLTVDNQGAPMLQNDMGKALNTLSDTVTLLLQEQYSAKNVSRAELVNRLEETVKNKHLLQMTQNQVH